MYTVTVLKDARSRILYTRMTSHAKLHHHHRRSRSPTTTFVWKLHQVYTQIPHHHRSLRPDCIHISQVSPSVCRKNDLQHNILIHIWKQYGLLYPHIRICRKFVIAEISRIPPASSFCLSGGTVGFSDVMYIFFFWIENTPATWKRREVALEGGGTEMCTNNRRRRLSANVCKKYIRFVRVCLVSNLRRRIQ